MHRRADGLIVGRCEGKGKWAGASKLAQGQVFNLQTLFYFPNNFEYTENLNFELFYSQN
jgi:hypothetical protein